MSTSRRSVGSVGPHRHGAGLLVAAGRSGAEVRVEVDARAGGEQRGAGAGRVGHEPARRQPGRQGVGEVLGAQAGQVGAHRRDPDLGVAQAHPQRGVEQRAVQVAVALVGQTGSTPSTSKPGSSVTT